MQLITTNGQTQARTRQGLHPAPSGASGLDPKGSSLDPYADIEKVPLQTRVGMKSRGYTVRLEYHRTLLARSERSRNVCRVCGGRGILASF